MSLNPRRLALVAALCALAVSTATACSSSGSSGATGSGGASTTGSASNASAPTTSSSNGGASAPLASSFTGVRGTPPTAPAKPVAKALVWVVSCGQSQVTCSVPADAATAAAHAAGWTATICDGKLNPAGWSACIRQGIAAKATGIDIIGLDCATIQGALKEAKAASIPTVAAGGNDCDATGGTNFYTAVMKPLADLSIQQWWEKMGALQADWIISKTDAHAQVLSLEFGDGIFGGWIQEGFATELKTCPGCKVLDTLKIGNQDVASGQLPQKFSTALLKQPTANAVNVPLDGWFFAGLSQAVQSSGRSGQLAVIGAFGEAGNLDLIRKGTGEDATVGFSATWSGWAGIDALVRTLAKEPVQAAGIGLQVIDATHNMPAAGQQFSYSPSVDFAASYKKAWGTS